MQKIPPSVRRARQPGRRGLTPGQRSEVLSIVISPEARALIAEAASFAGIPDSTLGRMILMGWIALPEAERGGFLAKGLTNGG